MVKHNPEVNWENGTIKFTRCPGNCTMTHKDIQFNSRQTKEITTDKTEQDNSEVGKEPDTTNPEDLPKYIRPFTHLFNKKEWKWEKEHQEAFDELKEKITSQPVLSLPKREGKFRVETDASGHAIGGVLSQEQEGKWKPIAFLSRTMQAAEQNYEIYDKELLAIVEALTKWRQYLLDAVEPFEVWTDHENLKYFREPHKLNGWQA